MNQSFKVLFFLKKDFMQQKRYHFYTYSFNNPNKAFDQRTPNQNDEKGGNDR